MSGTDPHIANPEPIARKGTPMSETTTASTTDRVGTDTSPIEIRGSGRGSFVVGLTLVLVAIYAVLIVATPLPARSIGWFAPTALVVAGVLAMVTGRRH